ncbi:MAG: hypothetical protein CL440_08820 [Acidimicrobiaceae bacterium]|jgi:hypothetical protein|nr:hypothetical protein [Acidimicrobiaceae bacterium]|tara:strand:- start:55113 stop:55574 length:462 start_codon:yes stop_codon:yes gene_type:complete
MVAGIIGLWVYAFFFAPSGNPDRIENENWIQKAEAICFQAKNELTLLPSATKAENPSDRAQVLEDGTGILEKMKSELTKLSVSSEKDKFNTSSWFSDWDIYLEDRKNHVDRLNELGDVEPLLTATDAGKSVMERMNGFARVNDLDSCLDPGDF